MPASWLDRLVGVCLSLLVGSVAVYLAVRLIEAVLPQLLVIIAVVLLVTVVIAIIRTRNRGW